MGAHAPTLSSNRMTWHWLALFAEQRRCSPRLAARGHPAVSPSERGAVDAVLVCLPTDLVRELATDLLRHHTPIVEAATLDGITRQTHWREIDRMALRRGVPAVVGAGWDPGVRPLFEGLFAALCPKGGTRTHDRPGFSLHHTLAAWAIPGVHFSR